MSSVFKVSDIPKLSDDNYYDWLARAEAVLKGCELWGYIDGSEPVPEAPLPDFLDLL